MAFAVKIDAETVRDMTLEEHESGIMNSDDYARLKNVDNETIGNAIEAVIEYNENFWDEWTRIHDQIFEYILEKSK